MNETTTPEPQGSTGPGSAGPGTTTTEPPPDPPRAGINTDHLSDYRELRRSATDRKIAGVAGGLARHLDVDPLVVRVVLVVLAIFGGAGILLYGALWLLVPEESDGSSVFTSEDSTRNVLVIVALVVATLIAFTAGLGTDTGAVWFFSLVLLAVLGFQLLRGQRPRAERPAPTYSYAAPPAGAPSATWTGEGGTPVPPYAAAPQAWAPPPRRRRRGPLLFLPTLALVALVCGLLGLADANGADVPDAGYAALALAITGAMMVLGSFFGRAGGLVLLALVSGVTLAATAVAEPSYDGDRDLVVRPTSAAVLDDSYFLPAGRVTVDLTEISEPSALDGRELEVDVNAGEIVVLVPDGVNITLDAQVRYGGAIDTPDGDTSDGWNVQQDWSDLGAGDDAPTVDLDLEVAFGHIDVRRG